MTHVERELSKFQREIQMSKKKLAIHTAFHSARIKDLEKDEAILRLMNDIRLGKIIPVVAENGTIANVTFS
jgi:hypothetical protein